MRETSVHDAWNTFWERNQAREHNGRGGCLPDGWRGIADTQQRVWQSFSRRLNKGHAYWTWRQETARYCYK